MDDHAYPLIAIRDDGRTIVADTPDEAIGLFRNLRFGEHHVDRISHERYGANGSIILSETVIRSEWIVRDDEGNTLSAHDVPQAKRQYRGWSARRLAAVRHAAENGLPIPGIRRWRRTRYFRRFAKNIAMRAAEVALDQDLEDWDVAHMDVGRRRVPELPKWGDDLGCRSRPRSWKDQRRTQWR